MVNNEVNTVVLSKTSYDNMRGTNDRASTHNPETRKVNGGKVEK